MGNYHARCGAGEKPEVTIPEAYLSLFGRIPNFEKLIATIRSRNISADIILQSKAQLKTIYKDAADTIDGNCDTTLFLGGKEKTTLKDLEEILGKETIDLYNLSDTKSNSPSSSISYQKTGKSLMTQDEIAVMDGSKCICYVRGVRPFLSRKFDIKSHKRYKMLADGGKKNLFDVKKYLENERKKKHNRLSLSENMSIDEVYDAGVIAADSQ